MLLNSLKNLDKGLAHIQNRQVFFETSNFHKILRDLKMKKMKFSKKLETVRYQLH